MAVTYQSDNIVKITFESSGGFTLTYKDLMQHLRYMQYDQKYPVYIEPPKNDDGVESISDEQKDINARIKNIAGFNATVFTQTQIINPVTGKRDTYNIDNKNYNHISVNSYYLDDPVLREGDAQNVNPTITSIKSIFFSNTNALVFKIDETFEDTTEDGELTYTSIKNNDSFFIYLTVETIDKNVVPIYYEFIYKKPKDSLPDGGSDDEINNDTPILPGDIELNDENEEISVITEYEFVDITDDECAQYAFFNTISLKQLMDLPNHTLVCKDAFVRVYISPLCPKEFSFTINVNINGISTPRVFSYTPHEINIGGNSYKRCIKMDNPDVSYALIRTNPKLTGNIKVVVDKDSNLYLDTFKVNNTLSQKLYRKVSVGSKSYYGKNVMNTFKDVPTTELYDIEDKCTNLFTTVQDFKDQYYDVYRSGVKTNDDNLYKENFAMLAPLCVKRIIPDFFIILKIDKQSHPYSESLSDDKKLEYFMRFGKVIKSYDMRENSKLGTYIRNIYNQSKSYPGDAFVSYDTDNYNTFIGISLDRGIVAPIYESVFLEKDINNQVAQNDFFTKGFERNHIVSKDIINLEYMFDDEESELFSINTYMGLYIKVNEENSSFSCIGETEDNMKLNIFNVKNNEPLHTFPGNIDLNVSQYGTLIYGLTTPYEFKRLNSGLYDAKEVKEYKLKPYKNVLTSNCIKYDISNNIQSYITFELQKPLNVGEHIRCIDHTNNVVYEIITSDIEETKENSVSFGVYADSHNLSDVIINSFNEYNKACTLYRLSMYIDRRSETEDFSEDTLYDQIKGLYYAFRKLGKYKTGEDYITSYKFENNKLSLVSSMKDITFQRICSESGINQTLNNYILTTQDEDETLKFFGHIYAKKTIQNVSNINQNQIPTWKNEKDIKYYPIHFDLVGNRMSYIMDFINVDKLGSEYYSVKLSDFNIFNDVLLYASEDKDNFIQYENISMDMYENADDSQSIVKKIQQIGCVESYDNFDNYIIPVKNPYIINGKLSLYSIYPLNAGLCSIFNYKDFNFNVLDNNSSILASSVKEPEGESGEFCKGSIFNSRPNMSEPYEPSPEDIVKPDVSYNELSMYDEEAGDSILQLESHAYVIKHMTLEEFKLHIVEKLKKISTKTISIGMQDNEDVTLSEAVIRNATNPNLTTPIDFDNIITIEQRNRIENLLGLNFGGEYDGYILRPFIKGTYNYDLDYEYYNHIVKFNKTYSGVDVNLTELDGESEFIYQYTENIDEGNTVFEYTYPNNIIISNSEKAADSNGTYVTSDSLVLEPLDNIYNTVGGGRYFYFPINSIIDIEDNDKQFVCPYYVPYFKHVMTVDGEPRIVLYKGLPFSSLISGIKTSDTNPNIGMQNVKISSHPLSDIFANGLDSTPIGVSESEMNTIQQLLNTEGVLLERKISLFQNTWSVEPFVNPEELTDENLDENNISDTIEIDNNFIIEPVSVGDVPMKSNNDEEDIRDYIDKYREDYNINKSLSISNKNLDDDRFEYFKNLYNKKHTKLDVPLVSPYVCKWKSNGTDARVEDLRLMYDYKSLLDGNSYFCVGDSIYNEYPGILYLKNKNTSYTITGENKILNGSYNKYINKSLNDISFIKNENNTVGKFYKDYILYNIGSIDDLLYDNVNSTNKFSVAYNSGNNTIEFISAGIKFKITSSNDNILDFSKYNGYSVAFINLPFNNISSDKEIELIIDETKNEIILIWYSNANTLEYGVKCNLSGPTELFSSLKAYKIKYNKSLADVTCSNVMDSLTGKVYNSVDIEDEDNLAFNDTVDNTSEFLVDGKNAHKGTLLCSKNAFLMLSNIGVNDQDNYSKQNNIIITGKIFRDRPIIENQNDVYPYFHREGYITALDPFLWHNDDIKNSYSANSNYHEKLSNSLIDEMIHNTANIRESYIFTDNIELMPSNKKTVEDLKNSIEAGCNVFVKTSINTKNYDNISDLITINIIEPFKYNRKYLFSKQINDINENESAYVHSMYVTPVMYNMFNFNYSGKDITANTHIYNYNLSENDVNDAEGTSNFGILNDEYSNQTNSVSSALENIFEKSFDGANISISSVNKINQIWINKVSDNSNYSIEDDLNGNINLYSSIDVVHNVSILDDSWTNTVYKKYSKQRGTKYNYEVYETIPGYKTGYELKTFLNSKGIVLKSPDNINKKGVIEITNWKNTYISNENNYIKLDITNSIVHVLLQSDELTKAWQKLKLLTDKEKIIYIKNNIMKYIIINNKMKFVLRKGLNKTKSLQFNGTYTEANTLEEKNFKNSLTYDNGKYYMEIFPQDKYKFYAKMIINL